MTHLYLKANILFIIICSLFISCIYIKKESEEDIQTRRERARLDSLYAIYDSMPPPVNMETLNKKRENDHFYFLYDKDSTYILYRFYDDSFSKDVKEKNSLLRERFVYDTLGVIQKRYTFLYNDFLYGKWYDYDENGKLIDVKEINTNFAFTFYDLLAFVDSIGIERAKLTFDIRLDSVTNKHYWYIYEQTAYAAGRDFHLDAETGEILKYEEYDWEERNKRGEYYQDLY